MNVELPKINHSEDFYIWFSPEKKEEYYSTPQYFYKSNYRIDYDNKLREIYWKETEKTEGGIKHPSTLFYPFHEKLGMFLVNFLNADNAKMSTHTKLTDENFAKWNSGMYEYDKGSSDLVLRKNIITGFDVCKRISNIVHPDCIKQKSFI